MQSIQAPPVEYTKDQKLVFIARQLALNELMGFSHIAEGMANFFDLCSECLTREVFLYAFATCFLDHAEPTINSLEELIAEGAKELARVLTELEEGARASADDIDLASIPAHPGTGSGH